MSVMVLPVSTMSSTMMTRRPFRLSDSPMSCLTWPVDDVPQYDAILTKDSSDRKSMYFISEAVNMNEPLSTLRNTGMSPSA